MSPIRIYHDAWNGAVHAFHPATGPAARSLRPAAEKNPAGVAAPARRAARARSARRWLEGPAS